jgi:arginine utilization protein RocB
LYLLPPFYPHAAPGDGPLSRAARAVAMEEGIALRSFYPFISDASYVAWRCEGTKEIGRYFPALGREYALPVEASRALDLEVVNLGPWGRNAHGLFERVHAPYAFERLPKLIARTVEKALEE